MDCWYYKVLTFDSKGVFGGILDTQDFENQINIYGKDGWELVSCFDTSYGGGGSRKIVAVMKRKRY